MLELDEHNTLDYLRERALLPADAAARVQLLGWGVSNVVLRVTCEGRDDFVIKQSREQLRTAAPWFSRLDRVFREMGVLRQIAPLLPDGVIPRVLFEDRENFLFGMQAVDARHTVWKQLLLEGNADTSIATRLGTYLGTIHRETAGREDVAAEWGDLEVFDQLRLDPFYRRLGEKHPEIAGPVATLVSDPVQYAGCLVLADFSPKNILITGDAISLVDFETGHYGDPAFDLGFFLSHLLLKTVKYAARFDEYAGLTTAFLESYRVALGSTLDERIFGNPELEPRTIRHLAGCMWARIDATSPVDYLPEEELRDVVRRFCRACLLTPTQDWPSVLNLLRTNLKSVNETSPCDNTTGAPQALPKA